MNVFNLSGPEFLVFYIFLLGGGAACAMILRQTLRGPGDVPLRLPALDAYQAAYLNDGTRGAVHAAIASLVQRGVVKTQTTMLKIESPLLDPSHPFEQDIYDSIVRGYESPSSIDRHASDLIRRVAKPLEQYGLVYPTDNFVTARGVPVAMMAAVFAIGVIKVIVGLSRGRPVGFLLLLTIGAAVITVLLLRPIHRTLRGEKVIEQLKRRNAALRSTASTAAANLEPGDLAMAVGLFGVGALAGGPMEHVTRFLRPPPTKRDSRSSWSSCSGGSCGTAGISSCSSGASSCSSASSCGGGGGGCGGCGGGG